MRFLILSDIRANWEALEAVLAHAEGLYDRILCAGDLAWIFAASSQLTFGRRLPEV